MDGPYEERISGRKPTRKLTSIAHSHKSATATRTNAGEGDGQTEKGLNGYKFRDVVLIFGIAGHKIQQGDSIRVNSSNPVSCSIRNIYLRLIGTAAQPTETEEGGGNGEAIRLAATK